MSVQESTQTESKRRTAINQLGGPRDSQMYYDADRDEPVVLRQLEGWGTASRRDYMDRTWEVQSPRCYIADAGCELETISQRTKLERMESDRYRTLPDETVDQILDTATAANVAWWKVENPHIPYDGEGGVNVYVDGEYLEYCRVEGESEVLVRDDWPDERATIAVRVSYNDERSLTVETDGETLTYSQVNDPDSLSDGAVYEADGGRDGATVELRLDTNCEDHHETEYELPEDYL